MKKLSACACVVALSTAMLTPLAAFAQNLATVNGKPVPKTRVEAMIKQVTRQGQPLTPELEQRMRDEAVVREMYMQEAEKRGMGATPDYKVQMEFARQTILIGEMIGDFRKKNPVTAADIAAEYDKYKAQASGTEYRARHILVEKEDEANSLVKQLKAGAKFDELAKKHSKDPGSGANGGDLDFANPGAYVPEFSQALVKLKKGEMTDVPVKSQFGYHIIKLEDTREAKFPPLEEVKGQIEQGLAQKKLSKFLDEIRSKAKTDYKFATN